MRRIATIAALALLFAGCTSSSKTPKRPPAPPLPPELVGVRPTPENAVRADNCSNQMHDIAGAILLYYAIHRELPPTLEALRTIADTPLNFNCPLTNQPYVYIPTGLRSRNQNKLIILHDPSAAHSGQRMCILMPDQPLNPSRPNLSLEVLPVPEPLFLPYQPVAN